MAKGKGKGRGHDDREILQEDSQSELSNGEVGGPQPPAHSQFMTPTTGQHIGPERALSPSISTWERDNKPFDLTPIRQPTFGTVLHYSGQPKPVDVLSPLPKQVVERQAEFLSTGNQAGSSHEHRISAAGLPRVTKGSTSTTMNTGREAANEKRWIEQIAVEDLQPIQGPLQDLSSNGKCYSAVHVEFYATQPIMSMYADRGIAAAVTNRWIEALRIGGGYLSRNYGITKRIDAKMLAAVDQVLLRDVLAQLDDLLNNIDKYSDRKRQGFRLDRQVLYDFTQKLTKLRGETEEKLIAIGNGMPGIPQWGLEGNANHYWSANDFEIMGACYREEVNQFCIEIMHAYHAHTTKSPTIEDRILPERQSTPVPRRGDQQTTPVRRHERPARESPRQNLFEDAPPTSAARVQSFTNRNASIFGNPSKNTSSQKLAEVLGSQPRFVGAPADPNDPDGDDDDEGDDGRRGPPRNPQGPFGGPVNNRRGGGGIPPRTPPRGNNGMPGDDPPPDPQGGTAVNNRGPNMTPSVSQFDSKLKVDVIPTWDGDTDELGRWLIKINRLSERSQIIYQQLGYLVPTRLTGAAELWYYSQSSNVRHRIEQNWSTLKNAIAAFYMNRSYLERQRSRANRARYRQQGHYTETPSEYFIRKLELLEIVYNYSEGELINEIMAGAPSFWSTILAPHLYDSIENFQMAIKFQEDNLLRVGAETSRLRQEIYTSNKDSKAPFNKTQTNQNARVHAVGWSKNTSNPPFPKDDTNVSPRGAPEDKGGRPCRHCGSGKHWDPECKYARKGERRARVNVVTITQDETQAQDEYDDLYYGLISDDEENSEEDFH